MNEPIWLSRQVVEIIHLEQIAEHGGRGGLRDETVLESALARPRQSFTYDADTSLPKLAATLCIGLGRNHPFIDGNRLVALVGAYTFLELNGLVLEADEFEAAEIIESLATGKLDEDTLAKWIADHVS